MIENSKISESVILLQFLVVYETQDLKTKKKTERKRPKANKIISQGSDISNVIGSDQKVAPYQLVAFKGMTSKSDSLPNGARIITPKGSMNTGNFGKTLLFVE